MSARDQDLFHELAQALRPALSLDEVKQPPIVSLELAKYAIHRHRVGPLLHAASKQHVDIQMEEGAREFLEVNFKRNAVTQMRQKAVESTLNELLSTRGIGFSFLKGRGLAEQLYGDQQIRVAKDIDILVEQSQFRAAIDALVEQGFLYRPLSLSKRERATLFKQRFDARIFKDVTFVDPSQSVTIELHWRLFRFEPNGLTEQLSDAIGWSKTPQLSEPFYCLYLILHGAISYWHRLKWVVDLSLLAEKMDDRLIQDTMQLAREFGCSDTVVASLRLLSEVFPGSVPEQWDSILGENQRNEQVARLLGYFRSTLMASDFHQIVLPRRNFHPSGTANLIFAGKIGFVPSAVNRLLGSLSVRI